MKISPQSKITADILHYCIKGIEVPYIRGQIGEELDDETGWRYVAKIVYGRKLIKAFRKP